jgi:hypothetical protein
MKVNLPSDFAKAIADALGWKIAQVDNTFDFEEDKQGFFWAKLKPKKFLEKPDFRTVCALTRDLGGEGYLMGAKAWKVPGPYAKKEPVGPVSEGSKEPVVPKPVTTSTPVSSVAPDVMKYDKSKPPELEVGPPQPEPVDFAKVTCSVCGAVFRLVHHGLHDHRAEYYQGEEKTV